MTSSFDESHPFLSMLFGIALGLYLIKFSRFMYRNPDRHVGTWRDRLSLPQAPWAWKFVRVWGVILMFIGCIVLLAGIMVILPVPRGLTTLWIVLGISAAATFLLLPQKLPPTLENVHESRRRVMTPDEMSKRRELFQVERSTRRKKRQKS